MRHLGDVTPCLYQVRSCRGHGGNAPQMKNTTWISPPGLLTTNFCEVLITCIKFLPPQMRAKEDIAPQVNVSSYVAGLYTKRGIATNHYYFIHIHPIFSGYCTFLALFPSISTLYNVSTNIFTYNKSIQQWMIIFFPSISIMQWFRQVWGFAVEILSANNL